MTSADSAVSVQINPDNLEKVGTDEYLTGIWKLGKKANNTEPLTDATEAESDFSIEVSEVLDEVEALLNRKNKAYGNSALEPVRVFSTADPVEQIKVRIDDKLSRLKSSTDDNEDTVLDLMGYLVLLRIATRKND